MYTLYGFPKTRSVRVAWALEELGLPYDYEQINLRAGEHKSADFLAMNPAGKIPALLTPEGPMTESAAIVTWLMDRHGSEEFIPAIGSKERLLYEQAMLFLVTELESPLWTMAKHTFVLAEDKRLPAMLDIARDEYNIALKVFSEMLSDREYLTGYLFTGVDIVAGHILAWAKSVGFEFEYQNVSHYAQRVLSRRAYEAAWKKEEGLTEKG